jgi:tetratricopeptide (TPR) repeat protein
LKYIELALERDALTDVIWFQASSESQLETEYQEFLRSGEVGIKFTSNASVLRGPDTRTFLESIDSKNVIYVFDEVNEGTVFHGPSQLYLSIPQTKNATIIFTSQSYQTLSGLLGPASIIQVPKLALEHAEALLFAQCGVANGSNKSLASLALGLGCVPRSIVQAARCITSYNMITDDYFEFFTNNEDARRDLLSSTHGITANSKQLTLKSTSLSSLLRIQRHCPIALQIISQMALTDCENIPSYLFSQLGHSFERAKALGLMQADGLIAKNEQTKSFTLNKWIALCVRDDLCVTNELHPTFLFVQTNLKQACPTELTTKDELDKAAEIMQHIKTLVHYGVQRLMKDLDPTLIITLLEYHLKFSYYDAALEYGKLAVKVSESCGEASSETLPLAMHVLGNCYLRLRRDSEAEEIFVQALERASKFESLDLLCHAIDCSIAWCRHLAKNYSSADEIWSKIISNTANDENLPSKKLQLRALSKYGSSLLLRGNLDDAETVLQKVKDIRLATYGLKCTATLNSLNNLALVQQRRGNLKEAIQLHQTVWEERIALLGKEHLDCLKSLGNIGSASLRLGDFDTADKYFSSLLTALVSKLGHHHPQTVDQKKNMVRMMYGQGHFQEALDLTEDIISSKRLNGEQNDIETNALEKFASDMRVWLARGHAVN